MCQEFLRGQDSLHFSLEQVPVQGMQIQVPEFLAGKSSEKNYSYKEMPGNYFSLYVPVI